MAKVRDAAYIKAFGNKLRELRKNKGFTITQLANLCDVEYRQISDIELGKINTTISTVKVIAEALNIEPKELFEF